MAQRFAVESEKPKQVNQAALAKKVKAQLAGIDTLERLTHDLVRLGIGNMNAKLAATPTSQPITAPVTATMALSVTVSNRSCQRRAPYQVSRRLAASRSRLMLRAARTAKAKRRAAASPAK